MTGGKGINGIAQSCLTLRFKDHDKLRKQAYSCKQCASCREWHWTEGSLPGFEEGVTKSGYVICPIYRHSGGFQSDYAQGKVKIAEGLVDERIELNPLAIEKLFQCTQCANCSEYCPQTRAEKLDPAEAIRAARGILFERNIKPPRAIEIMLHRPDQPRPLPKSWIRVDEIKNIHSSLAYFPGCVFGESFKQPGIANNFISLLNHINEPFQVLTEGFCCGYPAFIAGDTKQAKAIATHSMNRLKDLGVRTLVLSCAWGYRMFRREYEKLLETPFDIKVLHATEYLNEKFETGLLKLIRPLKVTATYHDPCQLGRRCGVFEPPRNLASSITGVKLVEMEEHKEASLCSGGGGGVAAVYPDLSKQIAVTRVEQAEEVGAKVILTACPYCRSSLIKGVDQRKTDIKVVDIIEVISYCAGLSLSAPF